jgi:hypothetical protein
LESSIDRYPGLSSWKMFQSGNFIRQWRRLRRPQFTPIPRDAHNLRGYSKIAVDILEESEDIKTLIPKTNAWMVAFGYHSLQQ